MNHLDATRARAPPWPGLARARARGEAGRRRRRRASERTGGRGLYFVTQFPLMELIGGVSVNSCDELIGGVSVNSRDFWLSVSVSPAAGGGVTPRCHRLLLFWPPPIRQILPSRLRSLGEIHHFPASASSSRSTSGEHQRWKSRPPERVSVVGFTCSGRRVITFLGSVGGGTTTRW